MSSTRTDIFGIEPFNLTSTSSGGPASGITFTPSYPGNWFGSIPDVQVALDQLSTRTNGPDFTFTPNVTQSGNTYGKWTDLMSVINSQPVERPRITFTENFSIPVGSWDLKGVILRSVDASTQSVTLTIDSDTIMHNVYAIRDGLVVQCNQFSGSDMFTFSPIAGQPIVLSIQSGAALINAGGTPLFTLPGGETAIIHLEQSPTQILTANSASWIFGNAGSFIVGVGTNAGYQGGFPDNWLENEGDLTYHAGADFRNPLPSLPGWIGTTQVQYIDAAKNVTYAPLVSSYWTTQPVETAGAIDLLAERTSQVVLASMGWNGIWFASQYVGPYYNDASLPNITSFSITPSSGFYKVKAPGLLKNFHWQNSTPPGSDVTVEMWLSNNNNPFGFGYSGVSMTLPGGAFTSDNDADVLYVTTGDLIVWYNPSAFLGYSPGSTSIMAQFIQT